MDYHARAAGSAVPRRRRVAAQEFADDRLAGLAAEAVGLAAEAVGRNGGAVDRACLEDFEAPFFDQDIEEEAGIPIGVKRFGERLSAADGLILPAPEYNASIPGALKNLIDRTSRIRPQPFNGRQSLLLSASPSMGGRQSRSGSSGWNFSGSGRMPLTDRVETNDAAAA